MKTSLLLFLFTLITSVGFGQSNSNDPCATIVPDFNTEHRLPAGGIQFTDASQPTGSQTLTFAWDFGNGNTSSDKNPFMTFDEGTYQVKLTISDQNGCSKEITKEVVFSYNGE
ncbi:PKD domain-containing protein [Paracrocinitomix mangrovi]|uniref:PKD domain-containing protein n=1 Tax=Paracrocinitomix mangrovi TaxID=2862509 RepID=UPI001C8EC133|nr:PKD domain-containing protein [Paracrocinitomix mangrovi]UKN01687.1 PKD domain-containing protein [Paracrocinitomix mangrovi]